MRIVPLVAVLILSVAAGSLGGASQDARRPKPAGELPEIKALPNPFTFADGKPVRTREDWDRRRVEIKQLFQDYMYGQMPPKPQKLAVQKGERVADDASKVGIQGLEVLLEHEGRTFTMNVTVGLPAAAKEKAPVLIRSEGRAPNQLSLPRRGAHTEQRGPPGLRGPRVPRQEAARGVRYDGVPGTNQGIHLGCAEVTAACFRVSQAVPVDRPRIALFA